MLVIMQVLAQPVSAEVPSRSAAEQAVRKKCAADFPNDFSTQQYCVKNGIKGYDEFSALRKQNQAVMMLAYDKCQTDFGNGGDWSTAAYCARTQIKGYGEFQSLKASASSTLAPAYRKCEIDFADDGDWSTAAYCAKSQRKAAEELKR